MLRWQIHNLQLEEVPWETIRPLFTSCVEHGMKLQEHKMQLEERRDAIRLAINEQIRPFLRPLTILDLPDEILRSIFEFFYVKGEMSRFMCPFYNIARGDVAQVKNLRLTCRRFCHTSSHLLMNSIRIGMTPQSVAYLDEVSRHPTISKGIRTIRLALGCYFDAGIACDIQAFAQYHLVRLQDEIQIWESIVLRISNTSKKEFYERTIEKAIAIAASWEDAARNGIDENCPEHVLLKSSQETYKQGYESQLLLQRGAFGQAVASAMKRMPTATRLDIADEYIDRMLPASEQWFYPEDMADPVSLQLKLQAPASTWGNTRLKGLRSPPTDTIPSILLSVEEARIFLEGINIHIPPLDDFSSFSTTEVDHLKLRSSSQQLRAFTFKPVSPYGVGVLSLDTSYLLSGFLSTILDTSALQRIDLSFVYQYTNSDSPPTFSMASVLLSRTWPKLKELSYIGPFYFEEMQKVVNRIGKEVDLNWSGYLMDASWSEVLDFLRGRVSCKASLGQAHLIAGAECEDMTAGVKGMIFTPGFRAFTESQANRFIRGSTSTNPVRDCENGELEMLDVMDV